MKEKVKDATIQIVICIVLLLVIFLSFKTGFGMIEKRTRDSVNLYTNVAASSGKANVSIDEVVEYPEVPFEYMKGDVLRLGTYGIKLKISGEITDSSSAAYGYYYYRNPDGVEQCTLTVQKVSNDIARDREAFQQFWYGNSTPLTERVSLGTAGTLEFYQDTNTVGQRIVAHNDSNGLWYMMCELNDTADCYLLISAPEPFITTDERPTVKFGDPAITVMTQHAYSTYETTAAEATLNAIKKGNKNEDGEEQPVQNPYQTGDVSGSHSTYTSTDDGMIRNEMIGYAQHKWDENGKAEDTSKTIDISSDEAKKSEWALTETTYSYVSNSLKISMLQGSRSATIFNLSGNINNTLDATRPFVLVVKFIGNGKLLGLKVIDRTSEPLDPEGVTTFNLEISKLSDKIDVTKITAVQFEIY